MNTTIRKLTLEEYLQYDDGTDTRYELIDGELVAIAVDSDNNNRVVIYLLTEFLKVVSYKLLCHKDTEIIVTGNRTSIRVPDLMILTEELVTALDGKRATITADMPPPALVVEVVSPGKVNENRDYRYKRSEYAARGISEYWIVDPGIDRVTILTLVDGLYEESVYEGDRSLVSVIIPDINLTPIEIFAAGK